MSVSSAEHSMTDGNIVIPGSFNASLEGTR